MTYYVLWTRQKDSLGYHSKVTTTEEKKDYPEDNLFFVKQFESLEELRDYDRVVTSCRECGKEISPDTRIYIDKIPPVCTECNKVDEVKKAL